MLRRLAPTARVSAGRRNAAWTRSKYRCRTAKCRCASNISGNWYRTKKSSGKKRRRISSGMPATQINESSAPAPLEPGVWAWLNRRTGLDNLLRTALYEPIPGGARLAYVFGSGLLFIFISQVITGVFLALYYVPSADHAHTTVAYITKAITAGSFLRSLHAYGASAMIVVLLLHLSQTYIYGAYKGRRELLWISGCVLFALVLGMAFTGYLLPWDQRAYFATAVGTNAASEVPLIGETLMRMMRGEDRDGHSDHFAIFCCPRFLHTSMRLCAGGSAHSFVSKGRTCRPSG